MKKNEFKVNAKSVNAAKANVTKKVKADKIELNKERKTTAALVSFLAQSESEAASNFRAFLNLPKNANKAIRKNVCKWIESRFIYVTRKVYVYAGEESDSVNVEYNGVQACNKNGKIYADMLQAIAELRTVYEKTIAERNEIARQMWDTRSKLIGRDDYKERIDNVLSYKNRAPKKYHKQNVLGDTIIRK